MKLYTRVVSALILALVRWCMRRGRYVTYVHQGQTYLRRYAVCGWLTGDAHDLKLYRLARAAGMPFFAKSIRVAAFTQWIRSWFPNLYVHQMINPDLDPCLHDHPWPWAVSWVALGGYREERAHWYSPGPQYDIGIRERTLTAPALNVLSGSTFHRIAELSKWCPVPFKHFAGPGCPKGRVGTYTIFLAGPRRRAKAWGYLVPGQGYVPHHERHIDFGGEEKRGEPIDV